MIPQRVLGITGLSVSRMGLGLAALGRPGYINLGHAQDLKALSQTAMAEQSQQILAEAYKLGIRYFDAARSYGLAEAFLAHWLEAEQPKDIVIGSKWGYTYTANWQVEAKNHEVKEHSLSNLNNQWQESKAQLDTWLNLYQIHSATLESGVLENKELLERLFELKQTGLFIGLSTSGTNQAQTLELALKIEKSGERLFDTVQASFNLFERSAGKTLELAHREGMGIIIKEAIANGRLSKRNQAAEVQPLLAEATKLEVNPDALALAWVLRHDWVDVVLSGAATKDQLRENVKAFDLDQENLENLEGLEQNPEVYWKKRSALNWN